MDDQVRQSHVGQGAPLFQLKNSIGQEVSLTDQRGKWVALVFYRGSWCSLCNLQITDLTKDYDSFKNLNCEIIAVSTDTPGGAEKTIKQAKPPFPILLDSNGTTLERYQVGVAKREWRDMTALLRSNKSVGYAMPSVFLIDPKGIVRWAYIGKTYTDRPSNKLLLETLVKLQAS